MMRSLEVYLPLDKSWIIRMGMLDLINGKEDIIQFLESQSNLSDDLKSLLQAIKDWRAGDPVHVGESGTLYRFLRFISWKTGVEKTFVKSGSLKSRKISDDSSITNSSLENLLKLDDGTSQWASAAVLMGSEGKPKNLPFKLKLTYEAVEHWKNRREAGKMWEPRYDETILRQANAFLEIMSKGNTSFKPVHSEDYCFARAFNLITDKEAESRWPQIRKHETDRITEMERAMQQSDAGLEVDSLDHRVIQAIAMRQIYKGQQIKIKNRDSVNKSWPQFWKFLASL